MAPAAPFRTRFGKISLKSGGEVRLLGAAPDGVRARVEKRLRSCLDEMDDEIVGYAFVVWSSDGTSVADLEITDASRLPRSLVPEFVKQRLVAETVGTMVREDLVD